MLHTERLVLRRVALEDAEDIYNGWARDGEVTRYLTWKPHESVEITRKVVEMRLEDYKKPDCARYVIALAGTKNPIGMIDVVGFKDGCPVIGYVLGREHHNKGYMTEALGAFIKELFKRGYPALLIEADERNSASNRVIEKCGFKFTGKETKLCSKAKQKMITVNWYRLEPGE